MTEELDRIREIALDPFAAARDAKKRTGKPVIGAVSSWVPDPLVIAAGGITMRFPAGLPGREGGTRARAHFQAASCFYCRSILEMGLEGSLDFLDGMLFVQSCDTQQNLSDIWKVAMPSVPVVDLYMPVNRLSSGALDYLLSEIARASDELGAITGTKIDDDTLGSALIERFKVERSIEVLYEARRACEGRVCAVDHYGACIASSCLPPEESAPLIAAAIEAVGSGEMVSRSEDDEPELACILAGSVIPYPGIYALLDMLDVAIRDDDLSVGRRLFDHNVPSGGSPFERVAGGLLDRSPGAVKHDTGMDRGGRLGELARDANVKHVVLPLLKFCDPWAWDYPRIRKRLSEEGVGTMLLELAGEEDLTAGPVRNRVEAYFEMDRVGDLFDV
ncbi:MAG: 2-hydroxyacyl-CoA dehydratase [Deltaproteobacteria bacterium]|nr:2-hydroxyacyl-CoA dehydratase [Deltaproteobacteria bacterium]